MLSVCMIVKNESDILAETLPSLAQGADELIIVDTGSTDNTVEVAQKYGAKTYSFSWVHDFAAARNFSLSKATQDWVMWLDADEFFYLEDLLALKAHLASLPQEQGALMIPILECRRGEYTSSTLYSRIKVFRNHQGIHFTRPINEQVTLADGSFFDPPLWDQVRIYHWGTVDIPEDKYILKKKRNITMAEAMLAQNPDDFTALYIVAKNYHELGDFEQSLMYLDQIIEKQLLHCDNHQELYLRLRLITLQSLGRGEEYAALLQSVAESFPRFYWAQWNYGHYLIRMGRIVQARTVVENIIIQPPPAPAPGAEYDLDSYYYWPHYLFAIIGELSGDIGLAIKHYRLALEAKNDEPLRNRLKKLTGALS